MRYELYDAVYIQRKGSYKAHKHWSPSPFFYKFSYGLYTQLSQLIKWQALRLDQLNQHNFVCWQLALFKHSSYHICTQVLQDSSSWTNYVTCQNSGENQCRMRLTLANFPDNFALTKTFSAGKGMGIIVAAALLTLSWGICTCLYHPVQPQPYKGLQPVSTDVIMFMQ